MLQILLLTVVIVALILAAKRFFPFSETEKILEDYGNQSRTKSSREDLAIVLTNLQRWRKEGKITREEYDHLIDICLQELKQVQTEN